MAVRKASKVRAALTSKGFREIQRDHIYLFYHDNDRPVAAVYTKISNQSSGTDIGSKLLGKMARQCRLKGTEFLDLVDCTLTEEGYRQKLVAGGHLLTPPADRDEEADESE